MITSHSKEATHLISNANCYLTVLISCRLFCANSEKKSGLLCVLPLFLRFIFLVHELGQPEKERSILQNKGHERNIRVWYSPSMSQRNSIIIFVECPKQQKRAEICVKQKRSSSLSCRFSLLILGCFVELKLLFRFLFV